MMSATGTRRRPATRRAAHQAVALPIHFATRQPHPHPPPAAHHPSSLAEDRLAAQPPAEQGDPLDPLCRRWLLTAEDQCVRREAKEDVHATTVQPPPAHSSPHTAAGRLGCRAYTHACKAIKEVTTHAAACASAYVKSAASASVASACAIVCARVCARADVHVCIGVSACVTRRRVHV